MNRTPKLSGSFLCMDYCNSWSDARFEAEMRFLKEAGMEYVVAMSAVLIGKDGQHNVSYPTEIPVYQPDYKGSDAVGKLLAAAERNGIRVFLGLNLDDEWWECWWDLDTLLERRAWLSAQMALGNLMADELYMLYKNRFPNAFYGFYWMWECWNFTPMTLTARGRMQAVSVLADCLNITLDYLSARFPGMPMLLSPFVNTELTDPEDLYHQWKDVFARTHFREGDIFCPQDSCGAGGQKVKDLDAWFDAYARAVASKKGLRFWANNENFETPEGCSTTLDNYVKQLEITDPYVEKHLCFSYFHYYSPMATVSAYHKTYLEYLQTGMLSVMPPEEPTEVAAQKQPDGSYVLSWKHEKIGTVAGFRIYRNGVYIGRRNQSRLDDQGRPQPVFEMRFEDAHPEADEKGNLVYSVAAYGANGSFSRRVTAALDA